MQRLLLAKDYEALRANEVSAKDWLRVLQIKDKEGQAMNPHILRHLEAKGIWVDALLGTDENKAKVDAIIQELKTDEECGEIFNKALNLGEHQVDVDLAIRKWILNVNNNRKKQQKRREKKGLQSPTKQGLQSPTALVNASPSVLANPPAVKDEPISTHLGSLASEISSSPRPCTVMVYIKDNETPYAFQLHKLRDPTAQSAPGNMTYSLQILKDKVAERVAPAIAQWGSVIAWVIDRWVSCTFQDDFETAYECSKTVVELKGVWLTHPWKSALSDRTNHSRSVLSPDFRRRAGPPLKPQFFTSDPLHIHESIENPESAQPSDEEDEIDGSSQSLHAQPPKTPKKKIRLSPSIEPQSILSNDNTIPQPPTTQSSRPKDEKNANSQPSRAQPPNTPKELESLLSPSIKPPIILSNNNTISPPSITQSSRPKDEKNTIPQPSNPSPLGTPQKRKRLGEDAPTDDDVLMLKASKRQKLGGKEPQEHLKSKGKDLKEQDAGSTSDSEAESDNEEVEDEQNAEEGANLAQYMIKPLNLRSWEDSGKDIAVGKLVRSLCYDEDVPSAPEQALTGEKAPNNDQESDDPKSSELDLAIDNVDPVEEESHRRSQEAKKELQKILEHMDPIRLKQMYAFFKHDEAKNTIDPEHRIHQDGALRPYQQHQAYGAFYMMWEERMGAPIPGSLPLGGGFLCDQPGFGKSATMACVCLSERWLNIAWTEVRAARARKDYSKHLPAGTVNKPQPLDAECPSKEPYGICCPCVDRNPSSDMDPQTGAALIMVPSSLMMNTFREWGYQIDDAHPVTQMRMLFQATPPRNKKNQVITTGSKKMPKSVADLAASHEDIEFLKNHPDSAELSRYVILCSKDSWPKQIAAKELNKIRYGRLFRDEFHQEPSAKTRWIEFLKSLNEEHKDDWETPFRWLASGTPFEKGPESMVGPMALLQHWFNWNKDPFWSKYTPAKLEALQRELKTFVKEDAAAEDTGDATDVNDEKMQDWNTLRKAVMIQRGQGCLWAGQPVMRLPRLKYYDITVENTDVMNKAASQIYARLDRTEARKFQDATRLDKMPFYLLNRACATFPLLAMQKFKYWEVRRPRGNVQKQVNVTTVEGMVQAGIFDDANMKDGAKNPFMADLERIINHSPKMPLIRTIVEQKGTDYRGAPAQMLIFTCTNVSAMVLYLWLGKNGHRAAFLHAQLSPKERDTIVSDFQAGRIHFIVTTAAVGGTGITLTRASRVLMVESPSDSGLHDQCRARAHRHGNYNWEGITVHEFTNISAPTEVQAKQKREGRLKLANAAAETMVKMIQKGAEVLNDNELVDLTKESEERGERT